MRTPLLLALFLGFTHMVHSKFPHCQFYWELEKNRGECESELQLTPGILQGCHGEWEDFLCWRSASVGQVVSLPCPSALQRLFGKNGSLSRNCTEHGWSQVYPNLHSVCSSRIPDEPAQLLFYKVVWTLSTVGHSLSLVSLLSSSIIVCSFRRLRCTRNYIHLNLFVSFMLRALAVLIKDGLLFSDSEAEDCSTQPSLVGCKATVVLFNYFVMANFFWLLVEGLYLHTLLLVVHSYCIKLAVYMAIGWGIPLLFMCVWVICRIHLDDTWCWEIDESPVPSRLINWPIMASVILNFLFFISIIHILVQKVRCSNVGGNEQSQYKRLAKSTLLLIPLFGVNYVLFVYVMDPGDKTVRQVKILFELGLGSFQGLIVAVLYCFLNSEVQAEVCRGWRSLSLKPENNIHCNTMKNIAPHRNGRAQSILQTETTVL
ncbi:vasoactive intestinal polypeptide receptor 2 isoform X2 [Periophthalmus magnuspinnatus]|uniref:vasoactive intestinal polypeptide receptor 2 isoform X2 n=1 Tax=Periophthalmus magnuspinnatus TaxID=409849 RepID=UPI002436FAAF|nr:vasoactive intestinal polypeptide receptor 2 isoform X2 [Periophthalmus magnuspinnatus]